MLFKKLIKWLVFRMVGGIVVLSLAEFKALADNQGYYYTLTVDISERKIFLSKNGNNLIFYPVAVPRGDFYKLPAVGELIKIELNPRWYPTARTRAAYLKERGMELPKIVEPFKYDSRNAMGKVRFIIEFANSLEEPILNLIRIHGTNNELNIGKNVTRGCIQLRNQDILKLADIIKNQRVVVVIDK